MSGGKGGNSTSTVTIPPQVLAQYQAVNARANDVTSQPFQAYGGQFVSPLTDTQNAGIANTNAAAMQAQPYYGAATNVLGQAQAATQPYYGAATANTQNALNTGTSYNALATGLAAAGTQAVNATPLDANSINQYMSPYLGDVLGSESALLNQNNQQQQSGQLGTAISSGAFGGDRAGIAAANLAQQQNLANANIYSGLLNTGYNTALGTAQQQQGVNLGATQANRAALQTGAQSIAGIGQQQFGQGLSAAQEQATLGQDIYGTGAATSQALAGLGAGAQSSALQGASAQLTAGQAQQATSQAQDTALYNQFLQQQALPYQQLQLAANIAEGTGVNSGSTTTTTTAANGIFSDERLKEDIKPVGKTYDGQTIYSYRYKGHPETHVGLLAQEVEGKHPDAVGLAAGYKTVDYDKATDKAAKRGHFAYGGAPTGFDPSAMAQMASDYQAMYGPLLSHGASGLGAAGGIAPGISAGNYQLHPAQANVQQQPGLAQQVNQFAQAGDNIGKLGNSLGAWHYGQQPQGSGGDGLGGAKWAAQAEAQNTKDSAMLGDVNLPSHASEDLPPIDHPPADHSSEDHSSGADASATDFSGIYQRGGRIGLAAGGDILPYQGADDLAIPDSGNQYQLHPATPGATPNSNPFDIIKDVKGAVSSVTSLLPGNKRGGRIERADGGGVDPVHAALKAAISPYGKYSDLRSQLAAQELAPQVDDSTDDAKPLLMTPAATNDQPTDQPVALAPVSVASPQSAPTGSDGTRATRNNNPGNIEAGSFAKGMPGYVGSDGRFAQFDTPANGRNAQLALLSNYVNKGVDTPLKIASKWAPPSEKGNNPVSYAAALAAKLGIKPTDQVTLSMLPTLASAQAKVEGFGAAKRAAGGRTGYADGGADDTDLDTTFDDTFPTKRKTALGAAAPSSVSGGPPENLLAGTPMDDSVSGKPPENLLAGTPMDDSAASTGPAPVAPAVANTGVGGAGGTVDQGQAPGLDVMPQHRGFFQGLAHGDANSIIPLLTGIGALATTQTNNPLTALAAGLGAGAQAYQGQREYGLENAKVGSDVAGMQAKVANTRANTLEMLQNAGHAAIGNSAAIAELMRNINIAVQGHLIRPEDVASIPGVPTLPSAGQLEPDLSRPGATGLGAAATGNAIPLPGTGAAPSQAGPFPVTQPTAQPNAQPTLSQQIPGLGTAPPVQAPLPTKIPITTPFDSAVNPGDGVRASVLRNSAAYKDFVTKNAQAGALATQLASLSPYDPRVAPMRQQQEALTAQAAQSKALADQQAAAVEPTAAAINKKAEAASDYLTNGYAQVDSTLRDAADASAAQNVNTASSLIGQKYGSLATLIPGLSPSLNLLQSATDRLKLYNGLEKLGAVHSTGVSARAEATEFNIVGGKSGLSSPGAAYDLNLKSRALVERQRAYSEAYTAAAPSMTNEAQWTAKWDKANPPSAFVAQAKGMVPLAKGMTPNEVSQYFPPVPNKAAFNAAVASGARYVNTGKNIYEIVRDAQGHPVGQRVWTGR